MAIFWADILPRFKHRLSDSDVTRIATEFAKPGLHIEPVASCMKRLNRQADQRDWFPTEWQQHIDSSLLRISSQGSRTLQALQCRRELLANTENVALYDFLMLTKDEDVRDFWLSVNYGEDCGLNDQGRFELLVLHYMLSLLDHIGLSGLHSQQFNKDVNIDEVINPYRAICGIHAEIKCKTIFVSAILESGRDDLDLVSSDYLGEVSEPLLPKVRQAKEDYASWISDGKIGGIGEFRDRFTALGSKYNAAMDRLRVSIGSDTH